MGEELDRLESGPPRPLRGVWLFPNRPAGELVEAVVRAEELGLDEVWLADEGVAREPMALLAAAASATNRITLATGVTTPLLRHPGALAASAATVDELSRGRFRLGLGIGGEKSLGPFSITTERPVGGLRDAIATIRAVLAAESGAGYRRPAHAFGPRPVPIWVGARGPQMVTMAAKNADGLFLSGCTPEQHVDIIGRVRGINPKLGIALYQSASDSRRDGTVTCWNEVAYHLAEEVERFRPTSFGINLVDLVEGGVSAVEAVEQAAAVLAEVASQS